MAQNAFPSLHTESECQEVGRVSADPTSCASIPPGMEGQVTVLTLSGISDSFIITLTSTTSDLLVFSSGSMRCSHEAFILVQYTNRHFLLPSSGPA